MKKLQPALKSIIWGGNKLKKMFSLNNGDKNIAESWEASVHPDGVSLCGDQSFVDYLKSNPFVVDEKGGDFPVLIKFIDAAKNLSVQVHPSDDYARKYENDNGKTEMWYIVQADKGAGIYCGFKRDINKEEFLEKIENGTVEELLNFIPVKAGEAYLIKSGTVHAIGAGCVICEVQQSSNVTYRVYDYNRVGADGKKRELHVKKAVDVINFNAYKDETGTEPYKNFEGGKIRLLTKCDYFRCRELVLNGAFSEINKDSFIVVNVIKGEGIIGNEKFKDGDTFFINRGEKLEIMGEGKILLTTENNKKYYAGIDLGGTFIKCGIADNEGNIIVKDKIPTGNGRNYKEIAFDMANLVLKLSKEVNVKIDGVGIGAPGTIDTKNGIIVYSNNIAWKNIPLCKAIEDVLHIPVSITNDANAAALGEYFVGAGKKYNSVIFITLGTGVGGGIVLDGKLFEGNKSAGAEIGHQVIRIGGEKCTCGRRGCFEAYASATALIKQTKIAMEKDKDSVLWSLCDGDLEKIEGKTVFDAVKLGDKTAQKILNRYIGYLAEGIINIGNIFRPEIILIGGGVSAAGDVLLQPLRRKVSRKLYGGSKYAPVKIEIASLENDAGLLGGVCLAMSE